MSKQQAKRQAIEAENPKIGAGELVAHQAHNLPVALDELAHDAGAGAQNVTAQDMATPIISILQANSPQCKRSDGKYLQGAKEGALFNNVTNEVYDGDEGLLVVPCFFEKVFIEWRPNRGGLVAIHPVSTPLRDQVKLVTNEEGKVIPTLPNGNTLTETNQHYVLLQRSEGAIEPAVISMSSTALKSSRLWNTLVKRVQLQTKEGRFFNPASYYGQYLLKTKPRVKDQYSWFTWLIEPVGPVPSKAIYDAGKAFEQAVRGGGVKVRMEEPESSGVLTETGGESDAEIPF